MNFVKQVGIILFAGLLIVVVALPLANTEWAEGLRTESGMVEDGFRSDEGEPFGEQSEAPAGVMWIAPFVKEGFLMGIPALITLGILKLTRRSRAKRKQARKRQGFAHECETC